MNPVRLCLLLSILMMRSCYSLTSDGILLLSFKYSVLSDPLSVLSSWNYDDLSPCSWNGVICTSFSDHTTNLTVTHVISLLLPNSQLLASLPSDLALIPHLRHLDLSSNLLNGSLPQSLLSSPNLKIANLADNELSGHLPSLYSASLQQLNLSNNALVGTLPTNLASLPNLTVLSLSNNYLSGKLPGGGFGQLRVLDLSSNLLNDTLPADLAVDRIRYMNLSYNKLTGEIPTTVGSRLQPESTVDISFNNFTGGIPQSAALLAQRPAAFEGNSELCGKPLKNLCTIPSTLSNPPNGSESIPTDSPPAFAAIPKSTTPSTSSAATSSGNGGGGRGFKPVTIAAIVIGDLGGIALLFVAFLYVYHVKKRKREQRQPEEEEHQKKQFGAVTEERSSQHIGLAAACACCLRKKDSDETEEEETTESSSSSDEAAEEQKNHDERSSAQQGPTAAVVTVDGEVELEMETLLKASAYILGATGSTIVYKAVLADGTALAVRRIGDISSVDKLKDFEAQIRSISKFRHPNLLRIWGFYWGSDEKLLIHDYAPNGSLANIYFTFNKKQGSSPFHLGWEARLRIARGVASGLAYIHEKKSVHGNIKPSNILLGVDMEPKIGDFGLDRLLSGEASSKTGTSARLFGSKRSMHSQSSLPELSPIPGTSPIGSSSIAMPCSLPYQAPESLKNLLKSNSKWDVYSFGMVLLELMSGRLFLEEELCQWNAGFVVEERNRIVRMVDPQLRSEVEGKEEALLSCFKLGFACAAMAPQRRPSMKDVVMLLDRIPSSSTSFY